MLVPFCLEEAEEDEEPEDEGEDSISAWMVSNSFVPSGVVNRFRDFWQNRRAEGRFPAFRCFWAMERHLRASSLLLSMVEEGLRSC